MVTIVIAGVVSYQLHLMNLFRPTLADLSHPFPVTGTMHFRGVGKQSDLPLLDDKPFACSANFMYAADRCSEVAYMPSLTEGATLKTTMVELQTHGGPRWIAMSILLKNGDLYTTTPEKIIESWVQSSKQLLWATAGQLMILSLLLLIAVLGFRSIWSSPSS
jgi:hypothetical protein